jgi:hypothetical protein
LNGKEIPRVFRGNAFTRFPMLAAALIIASTLMAQSPPPSQAETPVTDADPGTGAAPGLVRPLAIVPVDSKIPGAASMVSGAQQIFNGRAFIAANGVITSGTQTTQVMLPYRGTLRVCASSTVNLNAGASKPNGDIPGLMISMDHGAIEASFAITRDSDILLTPDFRILLGGPGAAEVRVRLGPNGDTCVDNAKANAPYVTVSSVFDGASYQVQAGQRVMFQHGSVHEVVDQEREPCGCPQPGKNGNEFPLAESEGLAPTLHPAPIPAGALGQAAQTTDALVFNGAEPRAKPAEASPADAAQPADATANPPVTPPAKKKPGKMHKLGRFFKKIFGAD